MALLTELPWEKAAELLSAYGYELSELVPLLAGSVNSNFLLSARSGEKFFARIYEEQGPAGAEFELRLNEALDASGVPVARPVRPKDGSWFVLAGEKPFAVYERLSGEVLCQKRVTAKAAYEVGAALARVHLADLGGLSIPKGRFDFDGLRARLERVDASGRTDLVEGALRVRTLLADLERKRKPLPSGLIHGDLFRDNVLINDESVGGLLDFESACFGPYAYDLIVTVLAWCYGDRLEATTAGAMLRGYNDVRPLTPEEKSGLALEGAVACARFATTRMTDFSLRVSEGETPARDYRRFFARLDELEAGVLEKLLP